MYQPEMRRESALHRDITYLRHNYIARFNWNIFCSVMTSGASLNRYLCIEKSKDNKFYYRSPEEFIITTEFLGFKFNFSSLGIRQCGSFKLRLIDTSLPNASLSANSTLLVVHDRIAALRLFLGFSGFSLRQHLLSFSCAIWISKHVQVECTLSTKEDSNSDFYYYALFTWDFAITVCCFNAKYCLFVCLFVCLIFLQKR